MLYVVWHAHSYVFIHRGMLNNCWMTFGLKDGSTANDLK